LAERSRGLDEAAAAAVFLRVVGRVDGHLLAVHPEPPGLVLPRVRTLWYWHGTQSLTLSRQRTHKTSTHWQTLQNSADVVQRIDTLHQTLQNRIISSSRVYSAVVQDII